MKIMDFFRKSVLALAALLSLTVGISQNAASADGDIQTFLSAPVWYLQYEVSFKASSKGTYAFIHGPMTYKTSLDLSFSAGKKLDLRSKGPSTVLSQSFLSGSDNGKRPSAAEMMASAQTMMARMDKAANWMSRGGAIGLSDNATYEETAAAMKASLEASFGDANLDYSRVDSGLNLIDPLHQGTSYNITTHTTHKGTGKVNPGVDGQITFEVDATAKKYALLLPFNSEDGGGKMKWETITVTEWKGEQPSEERGGSESVLASFPDKIILDDPKNLLANFALIRGDIDPSVGKITGECSLGAHYEEREGPVDGTLVFRYTLSMTPPAKSAATGK